MAIIEVLSALQMEEEQRTELTQGFQNSGLGLADTQESDDKHFLRSLCLTILAVPQI